MKDEDKTKEQSVNELAAMHRQISELKELEAGSKKAQEQKLFLQNRHEWEDVFNTITDIITIHDKDFNIISANKAAEKMLKLPGSEINRVKCHKYYHGTDGPPEGCPSLKCLITGRPAVFELFEPYLNMFLEIRAFPMFDSDSRFTGITHIARDITEDKKIEDEDHKLFDAVKKAKIEWEKTVDNADEFIILVDKELVIRRCNKRFAEFVGKPVKKLLGRNCYEFFLRNRNRADSENNTEKEILMKNTEFKAETGQWFYVSIRPIKNSKDKFEHSVIIATDITEQKNIQRRLINSGKKLMKRVENFEQFYSSVLGKEIERHELKKEVERLNAQLSRYKKIDT